MRPQDAIRSRPPAALDLRSGDVVEVRSEEEILSTLHKNSTLEGLPFMPEMLRYCGRRFRVYKRADKTCDTVQRQGKLHRMKNTVHLAGLRCDGSAHGNCEAACLVFWKESWLKRASADFVEESRIAAAESKASTPARKQGAPLAELCRGATVRAASGDAQQSVRYSCQATELMNATVCELSPWDIRQYWKDWRSGNFGIFEILRGIFIEFYNAAQRVRRGGEYPFLDGQLKQTPEERLNLQPGELVEVKSKEEILATVDTRLRNKGLSFDREMVKYCGGRYRVLQRVEQIIDEKTGGMMHLPKDCIILDGVICVGDLHQFCPRSIYPYWREIWLRRVPATTESEGRTPETTAKAK